MPLTLTPTELQEGGVSRDQLRAALLQLATTQAVFGEQITLRHIETPIGFASWGASVPVSTEMLSEPETCAEVVTKILIDDLHCDLTTLKCARFYWLQPEDNPEGHIDPIPIFVAIWLKRQEN